MKTFAHIQLEIADRAAVLTIDRPKVRNALDSRTLTELNTALDELAARDDVGVLIVTGAGDRAFVAGADIRELRERRRDHALTAASASVYDRLENWRVPTIAAINGHARGGGCELALACDLRIAAAHATFGQPEVSLGIIPAAGATQRLPRIVGLGRAKHLVLTGETIDAPTALAWGLVSLVVPSVELMPAARTLAGRLLTRGPLAMRLAKLALNASSRGDAQSGMVIEMLAQALCYESDQKLEGATAFLEKRAPVFGK